MSDKPQVVKLAQPGIDVKTAGDDKLVYNSNWPLLKIYQSGSTTISNITSSVVVPNQLIVNHNLGYVPAYFTVSNGDISDWYLFTGKLPRRAEFNGPTVLHFIDDTKIVGTPLDVVYPGPVKFEYYILAVDITKPYTAPQIKSGGVIGPRNTSTVFKIAKPGKDISSKNMEDYVVNSLARSPMLHAVYPGTTAIDSSVPGGVGFTYYHNLGYIPMLFAYQASYKTDGSPVTFSTNPPGSYSMLSPDGSGASGFKIDETKIQYSNPAVGVKVSLVVLKDPFDVDFTVGVTV